MPTCLVSRMNRRRVALDCSRSPWRAPRKTDSGICSSRFRLATQRPSPPISARSLMSLPRPPSSPPASHPGGPGTSTHRRSDMTAPRAPQVTARADEVLHRVRIDRNPYLEALVDGSMSLDKFRSTQQQFFFAVTFFPRPMAALVGRLPDPRQRLDTPAQCRRGTRRLRRGGVPPHHLSGVSAPHRLRSRRSRRTRPVARGAGLQQHLDHGVRPGRAGSRRRLHGNHRAGIRRRLRDHRPSRCRTRLAAPRATHPLFAASLKLMCGTPTSSSRWWSPLGRTKTGATAPTRVCSWVRMLWTGCIGTFT